MCEVFFDQAALCSLGQQRYIPGGEGMEGLHKRAGGVGVGGGGRVCTNVQGAREMRGVAQAF